METRVTTAVAAPPDEIWPLFIDIERWPELTASINSARRLDSGPLQVGSAAVVKQPRLPRVTWRVTEIDPGRSFYWETTTGGVTSRGGHLIEARGDGSEVTLTLGLRGPLARPTYALLGRMSHRYLTMEADGFRRAAESTPG